MPDFAFDEWMDAQLRNVPVPSDLHARLAAGRPPSDDELDALLRDVPVPPQLERHLRRIAWRGRTSSVWGSLALAASVLIVLGTGAYLAIFSGAIAPDAPMVASQSAVREPEIATRPVARRSQRKASPRRQQPVVVPLGPPRQVSDDPPQKLPFTLKDVATVSTSIKQAIEARLQARAALGASGEIERLPELDAFESPVPRGVVPPRLGGYDMLFQLRYGEQPFVSPAAHKDLRASRVPFTFRTASYDLAVARVGAGQLPANEEIRVEDFLAAQRYALPGPPAGSLALHAAASPSPLGEPGLHLLQLIVQGGKASKPRRQGVRLIAVVDTSAAMRFEARAKTVERALLNLGRELEAADRLTLIGFAEQPRVLAENRTRDELAELLASGTLGQSDGSADFPSAIQSACEAVRAVPSSEARRVVFVTAGRAEFDDAQLSRSRESLLHLAAADIPWQIIRLSPTDDNSQWDDLARRAHGRTCAVTSADGLYAVLLEILTGRPQTVANSVSMRITFNPKVVTSYRMLGHASATLTGEAGDPLEVDLVAEQTATIMFELWLKPAGNGELATAELLWRDPASGQPRRSVQPIRRSQVASSFAQAPPWLQQGILAASTAEFMRASYFVPRSRRLDRLLDLAAQVDDRAEKMPEFQALVRLIRDAGKLH
ncbi:MAG: VWA domain-containing protein [Pirellulales bacterium]